MACKAATLPNLEWNDKSVLYSSSSASEKIRLKSSMREWHPKNVKVRSERENLLNVEAVSAGAVIGYGMPWRSDWETTCSGHTRKKTCDSC